MDIFLPLLCVIGVGLVVVLVAAIKIVPEYERGVIFRLGRVQAAKGPGLFFIIPIIDRMIKVDLRTITLDVPSQDAIAADNVTVKVNAVVERHFGRAVRDSKVSQPFLGDEVVSADLLGCPAYCRQADALRASGTHHLLYRLLDGAFALVEEFPLAGRLVACDIAGIL